MANTALVGEILQDLPASAWTEAVPENYPLLRTLQFAKMAGAQVQARDARLLPAERS